MRFFYFYLKNNQLIPGQSHQCDPYSSNKNRVHSGIQQFPNIVHCVDALYNNSLDVGKAKSTSLLFVSRYINVSFKDSRIMDTGFPILSVFFCKFILAAPLSF